VDFSIENEFAALAAFVHALLLAAAGFLPCADCWNPQAPVRKLAAAAALCPLPSPRLPTAVDVVRAPNSRRGRPGRLGRSELLDILAPNPYVAKWAITKKQAEILLKREQVSAILKEYFDANEMGG
jgi:hypothetical protein